VPASSDGPDTLLQTLMATVRPEFRSQLLVFAPDDPVFGTGYCRVTGCGRSGHSQGMCQGHYLRWVKQDRPDLDQFAASTDPRWHRQQPNQECKVTGCGYGVTRDGLCRIHASRWRRDGRPLEVWLADPPTVTPPAQNGTCRIDHCGLWPEARLPFCHSHANTWKANGRPDVDLFVTTFTQTAVSAGEQIRLDGLGAQLRLEIQYVLQHRRDEQRGKVQPHIVMRVVRFLADTGVVSLLEDDAAGWRNRGRAAFKDSMSRGLLTYAYQAVEDLAEAGGWEAEYCRDVWQMHRLGFDGKRKLRFDRIPQPWLRDLTKRWVRWRLSTGLGLEAGGGRPVLVITRFARFLSAAGIDDAQHIDRLVLERYLGDLHAEMAGTQRHSDHIGLLNGFLGTVRQHRWDTTLPADARFFAEDYPKRRDRLPRALAEQVMTQLEQPDNLDRFDNPAYRLITVILMRCGLRVTDALRLPADCVVTDADQAPYLRYFNHKMRREALVPIDEELRALLGEQRQRNDQRWPTGIALLLPRPTKNIDGQVPIGSATYRMALRRWLDRCDIRDAHGEPVHLTPHQWRHTLGTRLVNKDVPQEVVRRILDHDSPQMTAHYARLNDDTVRRHWEAARKVNAEGETVRIDPNHTLAEAAWAKQRLGRATQSLPNGYCGLPVQKSCPHANACLTCPLFVTTADFLPQHRAQRQQTLELITAAEARGQTRLVEMNQQVATNLNKIITSLEDGAADAS
jgi:integrase